MPEKSGLTATLAATLLLMSAGLAAQTITPDQLNTLESELEAARAEREALDKQSENVKTELKSLEQQLVQAAARVQNAESVASALDAKLAATKALEAETEARLEQQSANLEASLAALTRIARQPEAAIVTGSGELIDRIRSANMLAAIAPKLRAEAQALGAELERLAALRKTLITEQKQQKAAIDDLKSERTNLSGLMDKKQAQDKQLAHEAEVKTEQIVSLAERATTLGDLIQALEKQAAIVRPTPRPYVIGAHARVRPHPRPSTEPAVNPTIAPEMAEPRSVEPPEIDTSGLQFTTLKGRLRLPVRGPIVAKFGAKQGGSAPLKGIEVSARADAQVVTPADGQIVYAGPFRSYGGLLIVNVGEGYHLLMAGLGRITAVVGQRIIAGEPVGRLGPQSRQNEASGSAQTKLYFEVRRQGAPVDPMPWLLASERKVSG